MTIQIDFASAQYTLPPPSGTAGATLYFNPSTITVPTGKENNIVRADIAFNLQGTAAGKVINFNVTDSSTSSGANSYGVVGAINATGNTTNSVKAIYGRAICGTSFLGTMVGLVGAVTVPAGVTAPTSWCLQLDHQGNAKQGIHLDALNPGDQLLHGIVVGGNSAVQTAVLQYNARPSAGADFLSMFDGSALQVFVVNQFGNVRFGGTAQRIFGDFSNNTQSSRTMFQDRTGNNSTVIGVIPNGSSTTSGVRLYNNSNPDGALAMFNLTATSSTAILESTVLAGGTQLPMELRIGGAYAAQIKTNKDVLLGPAGAVPNMTAGFPFIPAAAGAPGGTPTTVTGYVPLYVDTTNKQLCYYDTAAAAWRKSGVFN